MDHTAAQPVAGTIVGDGRFARTSLIATALAGALLVAAIGIGFIGRHPGGAAGVMPTNAAIEAKWGIRISRVAVTADGGLVDVRFVVIDPDKALAMMQDPANLPILHPVGAKVTIDSIAQMAARHDLTPGQTYFLLYRNTGGAMRSGGHLSLTFGTLVLGDVVAD